MYVNEFKKKKKKTNEDVKDKLYLATNIEKLTYIIFK